MADAPRARRLAKRISQIVASTLEHEVKDPRLAMVTITDTRITPDLREATVYYTVYGGEAERTGSAVALASARGVVRTAVGRQTGVRYTPSLEFVPDAIPEGATGAGGATYAGEPDPYRTPREDGEDDDADDVPVGDAVDPGPDGARSTG